MNLKTKYKYDAYKIVSNKGLLILDYWNTYTGYRIQNIWCECELRKPMLCVLSGEMLPKGTKAYRPTTNGQNRGHRIKAETLNNYLTNFKN